MPKKIKKHTLRKHFKEIQKDLNMKMGVFDKIDTECATCSAPFDKNDIEMVSSWHVTVRKESNKVNLYCPECWETANKVIEEFRNRLEEKQNGNNT